MGMKDVRSACRAGNSKKLRDLLEANPTGLDMDDRDADGETVLMAAARVGDTECVRLLLARGADRTLVNAMGQTAADLAPPSVYAVLNRSDTSYLPSLKQLVVMVAAWTVTYYCWTEVLETHDDLKYSWSWDG